MKVLDGLAARTGNRPGDRLSLTDLRENSMEDIEYALLEGRLGTVLCGVTGYVWWRLGW